LEKYTRPRILSTVIPAGVNGKNSFFWIELRAEGAPVDGRIGSHTQIR
jgi:hypothetical protein